MNPLFLNVHLQQLHKFNALWIPDESREPNLSGALSHNIHFKMPATYIGIQSRFSNFEKMPSFIEALEFSILVVLSGPEPQRSQLEEELKAKLKAENKKVLIVSGKTSAQRIIEEGNITLISYLNANDLFSALQKASVIVCRSGYSTVMDLAALRKKAILIPTDGQTEQEYLARRLSKKRYAATCSKNKFDIQAALKQLETIHGFPEFESGNSALNDEIDRYLNNGR
jgi:predicted glycosyltransferase